MDAFHPGCSFFCVSELDTKRPAEVGAVGAVGSREHIHQFARAPDGMAHLAFAERSDAVLRSSHSLIAAVTLPSSV